MLKIYQVCKPSERKSGIFLCLDGKILSLENSKTVLHPEDFVKEVSANCDSSQEYALVQLNQAGAPVSILQTWSP